MKIFGVGMFKTGTKSLGEALYTLGYRTSWWNWGIIDCEWYPSQEEIDSHIKEIIEYAEEFDAFCDAPWMYAYKQMDKAFPGSKFIMTTRKYEDVANSDIGMWVRDGADPLNIPDPQKFIDRIKKHEEGILEYFKDRPEDLLVINICKGEGWEKLAPFLGEKKIPSILFPHANKGVFNKV